MIHLGAKYSPCIRDDDNIEELLDDEVNEEYKTACCVNNDGSGCVQTSRRDCSVSILSLNFQNGLTHFWTLQDNQEKLKHRAIKQELFLTIVKFNCFLIAL